MYSLLRKRDRSPWSLDASEARQGGSACSRAASGAAGTAAKQNWPNIAGFLSMSGSMYRCWVTVQEAKSSCLFKETILFTICR